MIQAKYDKLCEVMVGRKAPVILIYGNPDPDAIGSAWALKEIMRLQGVVAQMAYTGVVGRLENEAIIKYLRVPVGPLKAGMLNEADLIAVVDAQPDFFKDLELPRCDIVFDHHPVKADDKEVPFSDIRPRCLATSSILAEYLTAGGVRINGRLATALYYGIQTDRRSLQRAYTVTDLNAITKLNRKIDWALLRRIEFSSYSLDRLDFFSIALIKLRSYRNVLYSNMGAVPSVDVCAQIADFIIRVKEANWAVVSGVVDRKLVVVFRCDGLKKDAGRTAEAAFGTFGSAGGHRTMGRAEIDEAKLPDSILLTQNEKVEKFVLSSLAKCEKAFRPVLRMIAG